MSNIIEKLSKSVSSSKTRPESYREGAKAKAQPKSQPAKPRPEKKFKEQPPKPKQPPGPFKRVNGFQHPLEIAQLTTWFFFGAVGILGVFVASVEFYDQPEILATILCLYFVFFAGTWYYGYKAHKIDPRSEVLPIHCPEIDRKNFRRCYSGCDGYVKCGSYHCRKCNKCTEGFDHHCLWLNNCIGSKNYFEFFMTLIYVDIYLTIWNGIGLYTFIHFFTDEQHAKERWDFMGGQLPISCVVGVFLVVTIVFAALVLQLMIFHGILIWRGTATVNFLKGETGESDEFGAKLLRLCSFAVNGMACKTKRKRSKVVQAPPQKSELEKMEEAEPQRQPPPAAKKEDFDPPGQPKANSQQPRASTSSSASSAVSAHAAIAGSGVVKQEVSSTTDESKEIPSEN